MAKPRLLVVEDDAGLSRQYRWAFPHYEVFVAETRQAAVKFVAAERPPIAIVDLGLPPDPDGTTEGFAALCEILQIAPTIKAIIATGNEDTSNGVQAVAMGAVDFYQKPIEIEVLRIVVDRAYKMFGLEEENRRLNTLNRPAIERIITGDDKMLNLCRNVAKLAGANVSVLLLGESGTGKEALARALHEMGPRAKKPFVPINCAAIPDTLLESELFGYERGAFTGANQRTLGKLETANHGTLFLDEIGDLPLSLQVKLLRFLQDQIIERIGGRQPIQVDVRIVCATNQDLEGKIRNGEFREDLFYRLNEVSLQIPPLRDRPGDPVLLASFFLRRYASAFRKRVSGFSADAVAALTAHSWPGNVRELENRVKRALVLSENRVIDSVDLELGSPGVFNTDLNLRSARLRAEREVIQRALARSNGSISAAAKLLGVSRPTLYSLLETHRTAWPGESGNLATFPQAASLEEAQ